MIENEQTLSKRVERIQLNGSDSNDGDVNSLENSTKTVLENGNQLKLLKRNKKSNRKLLDLDIGGSLSDSNALNGKNLIAIY